MGLVSITHRQKMRARPVGPSKILIDSTLGITGIKVVEKASDAILVDCGLIIRRVEMHCALFLIIYTWSEPLPLIYSRSVRHLPTAWFGKHSGLQNCTPIGF